MSWNAMLRSRERREMGNIWVVWRGEGKGHDLTYVERSRNSIQSGNFQFSLNNCLLWVNETTTLEPGLSCHLYLAWMRGAFNRWATVPLGFWWSPCPHFPSCWTVGIHAIVSGSSIMIYPCSLIAECVWGGLSLCSLVCSLCSQGYPLPVCAHVLMWRTEYH